MCMYVIIGVFIFKYECLISHAYWDFEYWFQCNGVNYTFDMQELGYTNVMDINIFYKNDSLCW